MNKREFFNLLSRMDINKLDSDGQVSCARDEYNRYWSNIYVSHGVRTAKYVKRVNLSIDNGHHNLKKEMNKYLNWMIDFVKTGGKLTERKSKKQGIKYGMYWHYCNEDKMYYFDFDLDGGFKTKKLLFAAMKDYITVMGMDDTF